MKSKQEFLQWLKNDIIIEKDIQEITPEARVSITRKICWGIDNDLGEEIDAIIASCKTQYSKFVGEIFRKQGSTLYKVAKSENECYDFSAFGFIVQFDYEDGVDLGKLAISPSGCDMICKALRQYTQINPTTSCLASGAIYSSAIIGSLTMSQCRKLLQETVDGLVQQKNNLILPTNEEEHIYNPEEYKFFLGGLLYSDSNEFNKINNDEFKLATEKILEQKIISDRKIKTAKIVNIVPLFELTKIWLNDIKTFYTYTEWLERENLQKTSIIDIKEKFADYLSEFMDMPYSSVMRLSGEIVCDLVIEEQVFIPECQEQLYAKVAAYYVIDPDTTAYVALDIYTINNEKVAQYILWNIFSSNFEDAVSNIIMEKREQWHIKEMITVEEPLPIEICLCCNKLGCCYGKTRTMGVNYV